MFDAIFLTLGFVYTIWYIGHHRRNKDKIKNNVKNLEVALQDYFYKVAHKVVKVVDFIFNIKEEKKK